MKFTIKIEQKRLLELCPKIKLKPAIILDYLARWHLTSKEQSVKMIFENEEYTLINFNTLINELPMLECKNKSRIGKYIKDLKRWGFIKIKKTKDNWLFVRLTELSVEIYFELAKKPYYKGQEMRQTKKDGKWWVIPREGGPWKQFAGEESEIIYK